MAELQFNISTKWDDAKSVLRDIDHLKRSLNNISSEKSQEEIDKLNSKLNELKKTYSEVVGYINDANIKLADISSQGNVGNNMAEGAKSAAESIKQIFDSVTEKVQTLKDSVSGLTTALNGLNINTEAIGIIDKMRNNVSEMNTEVEKQQNILANQAVQNNLITQQQQKSTETLSQQSVQTQNLTDATRERAEVENEVSFSVESTTDSIKEQTEAVNAQTEAVNENKKAKEETIDAYNNATIADERAIEERLDFLRKKEKEYTELVANAGSGTEEEQRALGLLANVRNEIDKLTEAEDNLEQKTEDVSVSANAAFNIYEKVDEAGNKIRILAENQDEANQKLEQAKILLETYGTLMDRVMNKISEMRNSGTLTPQAEALEKQVIAIGDSLAKLKSTADVFSGNSNAFEEFKKLSQIEVQLDSIKEEEIDRIKIQEEQARKMEEQAQSAMSLRTQITKAREEMARLIQEGKMGTPEFMELAKEAGEMKEQMSLASAYMNYFDDPNRSLTTLKVGLQGVAGAAGLVTSAIGLFNEDSKKMVEIQTKVQSVLGIVVGLETTYNLVKKSSNVMMAIEEVRTWAVAKARGVQTAATTAATAAQEGLNTAMKSNPYGAIIALLAILGTAIYTVVHALTSETEAEKKAKEEKEKHIKAIREQHEQWARSVASSAAQQISSYRKLQDKWNDLGDDLNKKKKFIKDNKTEFHNLGLSVNSVTAAENVFVNNTDAVVNSIMARAKAAAYQKVLEEQYEKEVKARIDADAASKSVDNGGSRAFVKVGDSAVKRTRAYYNAKKMGYKFEEGDTADGLWTEQGVKRIEEYNKKYQEAQKKAFDEREKKRKERSEKEIKTTENLVKKEIETQKNILAQANIQSYEGDTDNTKTEKTEKRNAQELRDAWKHEEDMAKLKRDAQRAQEDASIASIQSQAARERAEREKQHKNTLNDLKSQEDEIYKAIYQNRKTTYETQNKDKKYEDTDLGKQGYISTDAQKAIYNSLTQEEKKYFDTRMSIISSGLKKENAEYARYEADLIKQQAQSLREYRKQYGTAQQQRLAIAQEYAEKIAEAEASGNKWEVKRLSAERDTNMAKANAQSLAMNIDWNQTFDGIGTILQDIAKESLKKVNDYMQTAEFKALSADAKKAYLDLKKELIEHGGQEASNPFSKKTWDDIAKLTIEFQGHVRDLADAKAAEKHAVNDNIEAIENQKKAQEEYKKALEDAKNNALKNDIGEGGDQAEFNKKVRKAEKNLEQANKAVETTNEAVVTTGELVKQTENEVSDSQHAVVTATKRAGQGLNNFNTVLGQITSGSLVGFVDGISNIIASFTKSTKDMKGLSGLFGEAGQKISGIIGTILSIIDMLKDKPVEFFDNLLNGLAGFIEAVLSKIPEIIASVVKGVGNIVGGMVKGFIGLYGNIGDVVASIFGGGEDWSAYEEALDKWGGILDSWEENVKYERELMEKAYGANAIEISNKALKAAQDAEKAAEEIYKGWAGSGAGWFSHSNGYNVNEDVNWDSLRNYNYNWYRLLDGDMSNIFKLSWEEIEKLKNEVPQFWNSIHEDARPYIEDYINAGKAVKEITLALNEQLTTTTKENVFDDFLSSLYNLADGAEDVTKNIAENWQKMVNRMVINNFVAKDFQEQLEKWYEDLAKLQSQRAEDAIGDTAYQAGLDELMKRYNSLFSQAENKVNEFTKLGIIKPMEEVEKAAETFNATLDGIKSAFSSLVTDTDTDMKEWGKNLKNSIINSLIESMLVGKEFEEWAKEWSESFNNLWNAYNNGEISQSDFNRTLDSLNQDLDEMAQQTADKAAKMRESLSYAFDSDELSTVFSNLHDTFLSTLTNIEEDAKDFKKSITDIMLKDLIDQQVLGKAFTINEKTYETFDKYLEDWNQRYADAMKEGNQAVLDALVDELVQAREITITAAEDLRERLKTVADDTTFTSMESSFVSALMDMDGDVEDFADNLKKTIIQKLVEGFMVSERIKPLLEDLQNTFDHAMSLEISPEEQAAMIAQGYTDAEGIIHKGINDVAEEMKPMQTIVTGLLEAIGYKGKEVKGVFASLGDTIKSSLMNLDDGFESFMDSITETIVNDLTESYMATEEFQEGLKDVKKGLEDALNAIKDANTEEEIAAANEQLRRAKEAAKGFYEAAEEGTEAWREALRKTDDTTFTALEDSFVSALSDMDKTAEDWGQEIGLTLANKIIEQMVVPTMIQPLLKNVQKAFDDAVEAATLTDDEGNAVFDWGRVLGDEALANAIADMKEQYPELKALIESIMDMAGVETSFSNSLDSLNSVFLDRMLSLDEDAEDIGKQIGATLIKEMLEQMLSTSVYADRMEEIRRKWQDILTGKNLDESGNTLYTMEDVLNDISTLESDIANNKDLNALADKYKEITATAKEGFSDLKGVFTDSLVAMDATAETFGKQIGETMLRQMLDAYVGSQYKEQIKNLNQEWAEALESGNADTIDVIKAKVESLYATIGNDKVVQDLSSSIKEINKEFDTTFKSMSDSWVSNLMDMNSTAEKWAEDVGRTMAERIIAEMIVPTMIQPLLDNLQNVFNSATETANGDWSKVLGNQALREALDDITAQYPHIKETVKGIMDMLGLNTRADYRYSGFSNLSDTFLNTLKSIKSNAEDFSSTIGTDMAQQMAQSYIDSHYGEQIDKYNEQWQQALESGNTEAMAAIRTELEALYATIGNDQALQKLIDDFRELDSNLFADMRSTFVSSLMNMEDDAESFAKSIATTLTEKMVDDIIEKGFTDKIEQLGNEWREALESGDMAAIDRMTEKLTKLRDEMGAAVSPLLDAVKEINRQTDTTFSDMTDSWVSALMNMEGTAEEWAENVGKTMAQKIIKEMIAPIYIQPVLDEMQKAFNLAMEVEGASISSVISEMLPYIDEIEGLYDELAILRDDVFSGFDISVSIEQEEQEIEYALSDLKSNFVSSLMDMKNTTEDFSKDISKILAQTFIERFVLGTQFDQQMAYWQQQYENIIGSGMTEDERKRQLRDLRNSIASAKESYVDQAAAIQELFGLTTEDNQQATMNMSDKITYDQADQLLGINLAQELTLEQILATLQGNPSLVKPLSAAFSDSATNTEQSQQIAATLLSMAEVTRIGNDNILTQIAVANSHLQMIRDYAKTMRDEIVLHLGSMDSKLTNLKNL